MQQENIVTMNQMKEALGKMTGSKFPVKMTLLNGEVLVRYVRGFADQQSNIVLTSETSYSIAMKITEVKEIAVLEYAQEKSNGSWVTLYARWRKKPEKDMN
jgi:hypothetical protein